MSTLASFFRSKLWLGLVCFQIGIVMLDIWLYRFHGLRPEAMIPGFAYAVLMMTFSILVIVSENEKYEKTDITITIRADGDEEVETVTRRYINGRLIDETVTNEVEYRRS